ncbi:urate hydroxylase PuuD [Pseudoalteromonas sp. C2R02]|uniref:urate hydroxylase PuuD n=1 Tax=Pseudoalteromonas sp. C2R02 TaxID=2841565 RepID=UPI001C0A23DE|nr:urate hydroxylase PuuD [Pseudoalteromonas sp. C2R02]MBU2969882.1 urate hydroxylase PuuD [Pseudoalteromonas sp. C2R02]
MDPYITEWVNLILRFAHVITGIAWIGASFYFVWLDNHLEKPPGWKSDKGIGGDLWAIHGGGFYEVAKYKHAPEKMPELLHWFKWEAYSTWLTGFVLLSLMFYVGADIYLIDPNIAELSQMQAIAIGLTSIVGGWIVYDVLCRTKLAEHGLLLGIILMALITGLSYVLSETFSARGAFMHVGAVIGTIMAGNVFFTIMPSQRALVASVEKGEPVDPTWGAKAKLRSTHNTYATLPLVFIMISNHYPMIFNHEYNWLVLMVIFVITAAIRQYFVAKHKGNQSPLVLVGAAALSIVLAVAIAPKSATPIIDETGSEVHTVDLQKVNDIIVSRCASCHSSTPTDDIFKVAQGGVILDDIEQMSRWAPRIQARAVDAKDMPFMNKTKIEDDERNYIALWIAQGAPVK